jgi:hypothetical protein
MKCQVDAKAQRRENISAKSEIERRGFERVLCLDIFRIWKRLCLRGMLGQKKPFINSIFFHFELLDDEM